MGLFDYIECEQPLPDGFPADAHEWQTQDIDDCYLRTFIITADGRLVERGSDKPLEVHQDVEFYGSNVCSSWNTLVATEDGKAPWWRTYVARFTNGRLESLTGGAEQSTYADREHVTRDELNRRAAEHRAGIQATCKHPKKRRAKHNKTSWCMDCGKDF